MKLKSFLVFFVLNIAHGLFSQTPQLTEKAQISILTCATGNELFSSFGHTAIRVQDAALGVDVVYNYGTFDFNKPNFYLNFAKGKLIYSLSRRRFENFLFDYELERRWVKEQILSLTNGEVNQLFRFLEENYLPENRDYFYDPLFNNCSTIVGDILEKEFEGQIVFSDSHLKKKYTFREMVRQYLPLNSWGAFGIDLAFGGVTDRKATLREHMFLPYYAMYQLENTSKAGEPLVERTRTILNYPEDSGNDQDSLLTSPLFWFMLLLAFVISITILDYKHKGHNTWLDFVLFFISGAAGLLILLLWLATDHVVTGKNFNFLWLMPFNLFVAFKLLSKKEMPVWLSKYLWFALASLVVVLIIWIFKIQVLSPLNVPLMLALAVRYLFLLKKI
ncbi:MULTISPECIES: lipoprotein N-acyltransferase Lnb domain-containing protein [unclassified Croceitalea]|uniref:lipoprotein N-acyltransferase Lnb domain-containing protein n=1 Tax=unclassified Croceitalea TaxID=2632280 RepID=UPI0030D70A0D